MKSRMTVWMLKRKGTAPIWRNMDYLSKGRVVAGFMAYCTKGDALAEAKWLKATSGVDWEVIKLTEEK